MTNDQIIMNEAARLTPATLHAIATAHHTPEQIVTLAAKATTTDADGNEQPASVADIEIILAAAELHTFQQWKKLGKSVKKGETHLAECYLWQFTTKPSKAQREAAEAEGKEAAERPHFYPTKAHLFSCLQVEDDKPAPKGRFSSTAEIIAYNKKLAEERKAKAAAAKAVAEQTASAPAPAPAKEEATKKATTKPSKKASKPTTRKATKPAATKKAAKSTEKAPAAVQIVAAPATIDPAPVKQLDFESIAADLLA